MRSYFHEPQENEIHFLSDCRNTVKKSKQTGHRKNCCSYPKIGTVSLYYIVMGPKDAEGIANSVDPDQTALEEQEQSDLGLHCLPRPFCPKT